MIKIVRVEDEQLEQIQGGAVPYIWIGIGVVAFIVLLSGFLDGITNPKECGS